MGKSGNVPLTLILSPSEGERKRRGAWAGISDCVQFAQRVRRAFPLPIRWGEGQGEGLRRRTRPRHQLSPTRKSFRDEFAHERLAPILQHHVHAEVVRVLKEREDL